MFELDSLQKAFQNNFSQNGEIGASVSVWKDGEAILNLASGWCEKEQLRPWNEDTLAPIYSATKGPAAATLLMVLETSGLTPDSLVRQVWPSFPSSNATFAEMMSHQCGLTYLDQKASVYDYEAVIEAIENQEPNWPLGSAQGYHPRTYGFLLDQCVRILTDQPLGVIWHQQIAEPLGLDLYIGLPESEFGRVAKLYPGKMDKTELASPFFEQFNQAGSLVKNAFASPTGLHAVHEMNVPKAWQAALPAMGGVSTAAALAKFYQASIGNIPCFSNDVQQWMQQSQTMGDDLVLVTPTHFTCGFQKDPTEGGEEDGKKIRQNYGPNNNAFGHPGAGGSHAFADPDTGLSFAYIMNQMDLSVLPGAKSQNMIKALYA